MRTITVTGTGHTDTAPDMIIITMTVNAQAAEYEKTMETAAERLDMLREALTGCDFAKEDIRTVSFNVSTEYQHEHTPDGRYERRFIGYNCVHQLRVEFDLDMDRLSAVIAEISACSSEPEFSIQFGVNDEEAVKAQLLRSAAEDAARKAEILASASGVRLGELVSIDYRMDGVSLRSPTNFAMPLMADRAVSKAAIDIAPENISATENANFVWEIR